MQTASARTASAELRVLSRRRRALLAEAGCVAACAALLLTVAPGLDAAPVEGHLLFLGVVGLFSLAAVHFVDEVVSILQVECPRCARRFFGGAPDGVPSPLRARCTHCKAPLD